jgi:pimeloyl-ACP methyl ester carboxylesterase
MAAKGDLVLIPGLLCSPALWAAQISTLSDIANITVADHTRHASIPEIAGAILAAAPPRFALAGLSLGGYIACEIVRQARDRVLRLALLDTSARADPPERRQGRLELVRLAEQEGTASAQRQLLPMLVHPQRLREEALVATIIEMAIDTGVEAFKRQQTAIMARPDNRPLLAQIRCPALVLVGREDVLTPPALAQEIAAGIAGARLEIIPDCGHLSTLERPQAVNQAMRAWLGS